MSWTFVPSLVGIMLLGFGIIMLTEGRAGTGAVLLVIGVAFSG